MTNRKISEEQNFDVSMIVLAVVTLVSLFGTMLI